VGASLVNNSAVAAVEPAQNTAAIQKVQMGRAAMILSGAFIVSRVLGLVRQGMFSQIFGTSGASDAYVQAFLVPDTIFQIVAGGALASAFIPIFTKYMVSEKDEGTAWHIANTALTLCTAIMVVVAIIAMIFADPIVSRYNPSWPPDQLALTASLMRVMLLQSVILGSGVIINSVLQARQNFMLPAIGTVVYNVGIIIGLVPGLFGHFDINDIHTYVWAAQYAAWGVVIGAILQVAVQVSGLRKIGMHYRPSFDWRNPAVLQIMKQMLPRIFNASMLSLTTFVDRYMITAVLGTAVVASPAFIAKYGNPADGLTTQYFNAYQLVMLPLGIIGMAMSTAAFPTLAEYVSRGRMERVRTIMLETLRSILFLSIPSGLGLIILGLPVIQALLEHGAFSLSAANATAVSLGFYGIGLAGMAAVEICTRAFYALRDSRTPVIVSISQFVAKIALGLIMVNVFFSIGSSIVKGTPEETTLNGAIWGMGSLALATAISSIGEAVVLFVLLHQRIGGMLQRSLLTFLGRVLIATGAMSIALLAVRLILDALINTTNPGAAHYMELGVFAVVIRVIKLMIELFGGLIIYLRAAKRLKLEELGPFRRVLNRFKLSWIM
jgi:putative peptidoglycan lipid II flippase